MNRAVKSVLLSGTVAGIATTAALGVLAQLEGKSVFQPVNSTSHWLNGTRAASCKGADITHTAVGLITHQAATFFWAALFELLIKGRPRRPFPMLGCGVVTSVVAAAVDYGATPKRFTPGLGARAQQTRYGGHLCGHGGGIGCRIAAGGAFVPPIRSAIGHSVNTGRIHLDHQPLTANANYHPSRSRPTTNPPPPGAPQPRPDGRPTRNPRRHRTITSGRYRTGHGRPSGRGRRTVLGGHADRVGGRPDLTLPVWSCSRRAPSSCWPVGFKA